MMKVGSGLRPELEGFFQFGRGLPNLPASSYYRNRVKFKRFFYDILLDFTTII